MQRLWYYAGNSSLLFPALLGFDHMFLSPQLDCQTEAFEGGAPLPQAYGYIVVLGFGLFFSVLTTLLIWLDRRYTGTKNSAESYTTAGMLRLLAAVTN